MAPSTCISSMRRARFSGNSSSGRRKVTAALFTRMSGAPTCSITSAISRSRSSALRQVGLHRDRASARGLDAVEGLAQRPDVLGVGVHRPRGERDGGAFGGEPLGDGLAEPTAGPRDERDLPCTSARHESRYYARCPHGSSTSTTSDDRLAPFGADDVAALAGGASSLTYSATPTGTGAVVVKVAPPGVPPVLQSRRAAPGPPAPSAAGHARCRCPRCSGRTPAIRPTSRRCSSWRSSRAPRWSRCSIGTATIPRRWWRSACATQPARSGAARARPGSRRPRRRAGRRAEHRGRSLVPAARDRRPGARARLVRSRCRVSAAANRRRCPPAVVHGDFRLGNLLDGRRRPSPRSSTGRSGPWATRGSTSAGSSPTPTRRRISARRATPDAVPAPAELLESTRALWVASSADTAWFQALACFKSAATWSLIVKHNRRRDEPDPTSKPWHRSCPTCSTGRGRCPLGPAPRSR